MANRESDRPAQLMLIVHHAQLCEHIRTLLTQEPLFEVMAEFESGVEAVNEARYHKPDLILMDTLLPDADGLTITQVFRRMLPDSHVILLTCLSTYRQAALASGACEVVIKQEISTSLIPTLTHVYAALLTQQEGKHL